MATENAGAHGMRWEMVVGLGLGAAVLLGLGIILGHFAIPKGSKPSASSTSASQDLDLKILEAVMEQLEADKMRENLRTLSQEPHVATSLRDEALVELLLNRWRDPESGLDSAEIFEYEVLLSFPSQEQPNLVQIVSSTGDILQTYRPGEENLTREQADPGVLQPFFAYSPPGTPQGLLIYANRGTDKDFGKLQAQGINLDGTIALTRSGHIKHKDKVAIAARHGVVGVLLFTDPEDLNDGQTLPNQTYPNSWRLPPSGVERSHFFKYFGDPLTPYIPAHHSSFRLDQNNVSGFPPIPAQPISFQDARDLLCNLDGAVAEDSWQGALGCKYRLGPGFRDDGTFSAGSQVKLSIHNRRELRNSSNVLGIIRGAVEPDRYVLYGNHRDSWVHGAVDPGSGTAVLLELTRVLGTLLKKGTWRPRRSILFGSWGAEEFGLIGSTEFTEEFFSKLKERTVAYINVDIAVYANTSLRVLGTPPIQSVIFAATKEIPAPDGSGLSIFDVWIQHFQGFSWLHGPIPKLGILGSSSDYASFIHYLGISSIDIAYTYDRTETKALIYPAYHTAFDTFDYMDRFIDPGFSSHQAVARTSGSVLLRLSDSLFLPLNITDYSERIFLFLQAAQKEVGTVFKQHSISLEPLMAAAEKFDSAVASLDQRILRLKMGSPDPLQVRMINDQLMLLERAFLNPQAFPQDLYYSHVLWVPHLVKSASFPSLANACVGAWYTSPGSEAWAEVRRQLSILVAALEGAAATLKPVADL